MIHALPLEPAADRDAEHRDPFDMRGLACTAYLVELTVGLCIKLIRKIRTQRRDILLAPAVLHLYVEIGELRLHRGDAEAFVHLCDIVLDRREL